MVKCHVFTEIESEPVYPEYIVIEDKYVINGLKIAEYFLQSGYEAYQAAKNKVMVPPAVLEFAAQLKMHGYNMASLAGELNITRQAVSKRFNTYAERYPGAFGAKN